MPMTIKKLSSVKDKDERRFIIEDAARTFKRLGEIKREIRQIKSDPTLLKEVKALLRQEISDTKKAISS